MKRFNFFSLIFCLLIGAAGPVSFVHAQVPDVNYPLFNDKLMIEGYVLKLEASTKDILLAMINDNAFPAYRKAAALRVFRDKFSGQVVSREKIIIEKIFLRQLEKATSVYVQIELMHTLVILDRYRYFDAMVPALIRKVDHYDVTASEMAFNSVVNINSVGGQRPREARIEFNALRKIFFLTRRKLASTNPTDPRLKYKIDILRWSIKVLGTEELKNLPKEVLPLM